MILMYEWGRESIFICRSSCLNTIVVFSPPRIQAPQPVVEAVGGNRHRAEGLVAGAARPARETRTSRHLCFLFFVFFVMLLYPLCCL